MKLIHQLYVTFTIYVLLLIYLSFYDPNTPFYEFIDSTMNSKYFMNVVNRNKKYYYLVSALVGCILVYWYTATVTRFSIHIPWLMLFYTLTILYISCYNPDASFYKFMNKILDSSAVPDWIDANKASYYVIALFIGFLLIMSMWFVKVTDSSSASASASASATETITWSKLFGFLRKIFGVVFFLALLVGVIYLFTLFFGAVSWSHMVTLLIICLLIFILIAILIKVFYKKSLIDEENTIAALIKNCVLYIPCLIIQLTDYLKYEYSITTKSSVILLFVMITIIVLHFLIPYFQSILNDRNGKQLVTTPIYTSIYKTHGSYEELSGRINSQSETKYDYRYALSFWFYVNPQPPSTNNNYSKYTSILNYGNKPNILYKADENKVMIKMTQGKNKEKKIFIEETLPLQKWNHFVVNYNGGTLDVFLNDELVGSKIEVVPFMTHDVVSSGEVNGIRGGLCNVKYFDYTLLKNDISNIYNSLKGKNPPII